MARSNRITTPLSNVLRACTDQERTFIATEAGTTVNYLYGLAGCHRGQPNLRLGLNIARAIAELHKTTDGRVPLVTADELSTMCNVAGLGN